MSEEQIKSNLCDALDTVLSRYKSLEKIRFHLVRRCVVRNHWNYTAAGRDLGIKRQTIYDILQRKGVKTPRLAALVLCFILTGCITKNVANPVTIPPQPIDVIPPQRLVQDAQRASVPITRTALVVTPRGINLDFTWNHPGAVAYMLYSSTNRSYWESQKEVTTKFATLTNQILPRWYMVTALNPTAESEPSNIVGVLGSDTLVEIDLESTTNFNTWVYRGNVFRGTNPPGLDFFRLRGKSTQQLKLE